MKEIAWCSLTLWSQIPTDLKYVLLKTFWWLTCSGLLLGHFLQGQKITVLVSHYNILKKEISLVSLGFWVYFLGWNPICLRCYSFILLSAKPSPWQKSVAMPLGSQPSSGQIPHGASSRLHKSRSLQLFLFCVCLAIKKNKRSHIRV